VTTRQFLIALSLAGLTSCGGGDDRAATPHPQFPTTPANLTLANAPTFARFLDLATRAGATMRVGEFLSGAASPFSDVGCLSLGASPASIALSAATGTVNGTVTYTNFDRCYGMRLTGTASVTGVMLPAQRVDSMIFTFNNTLTFTAGTETIQASGSANLDWTSVAPSSTYVMVLNAAASGAASFQVENLQINSQVVAGQETIAISGRLTTSEGFVDIATLAQPQLVEASSGLQGGQITLTGATTVATVIYNGAAPPAISIP
jgi:hypothetical protein